MKKLFFLLLLLPVLALASGSGGFPSQLKVQTATATGVTPPQIKIAPPVGGSGTAQITIDGRGNTNSILWRNSGTGSAVMRWEMYTNGADEAGGDSGSDFHLDRYSDVGAVLGPATPAFLLSRATGSLLLSYPLNADGGVKSTRACGTGFTRLGLNFCGNGTGTTNISVGSGCVDLGFPTGASGLNRRLYEVIALVPSANAVGARITTVSFYTDSACTTGTRSFQFRSYEQVAVAAGTVLQQQAVHLDIDKGSVAHRWVSVTNADYAGTVATVVFRGYSD